MLTVMTSREYFRVQFMNSVAFLVKELPWKTLLTIDIFSPLTQEKQPWRQLEKNINTITRNKKPAAIAPSTGVCGETMKKGVSRKNARPNEANSR